MFRYVAVIGVITMLHAGMGATEAQIISTAQNPTAEKVGHSELIAVLIEAIRSPDPEIHVPAKEVLEALGEPAIDALLPLLNSKNEKIQLRAIGTLGAIGHPRSLDSLVKLYKKKNVVPVRAAALRAIARIVRKNGSGLAVAMNPTTAIEGKWSSNWGPTTLECKKNMDGTVHVVGAWTQGPGKFGTITSGTFNPQTRVFQFQFDEPWHNRTGTTTMTLSPDGKRFSGTWTFDGGGGGGSWELYRN